MLFTNWFLSRVGSSDCIRFLCCTLGSIQHNTIFGELEGLVCQPFFPLYRLWYARSVCSDDDEWITWILWLWTTTYYFCAFASSAYFVMCLFHDAFIDALHGPRLWFALGIISWDMAIYIKDKIFVRHLFFSLLTNFVLWRPWGFTNALCTPTYLWFWLLKFCLEGRHFSCALSRGHYNLPLISPHSGIVIFSNGHVEYRWLGNSGFGEWIVHSFLSGPTVCLRPKFLIPGHLMVWCFEGLILGKLPRWVVLALVGDKYFFIGSG